MKIVDTAIELRTSVVVLTALIGLGGVLAYVGLPKESNPSIEIPNIIVTTVYPGASPDDVEGLITQPIEEEIQAISGIKEIRSTSTEGVSTVMIEFDPEVQISEATQKVRDKVDLAKPELPIDAEEPIINEIDLSEFPILTLNLAAEYPLSRLKDVAEKLQDELEAIPSVLEAELIGGLEREVQVNVDLAKLQGYDLAFEDVVNTIRDENTNIPGGSIDIEHLNYLIRVDGQFEDYREIEDLVIKAPERKPIYVRDVATVRFGFKDRSSYARLRVLKDDKDDGTLEEVDQKTYAQVIAVNVKKRSGTNILDTADAVREVVADFDFPPGTQILMTGDQSKMVKDLVKDLENNIISGLVFVVSVLLFFLGVRTSILVGVAIPLSMGVSFIVFQAMGQTLNFVILFSLIIALGMLVDNAIVIVENIYRYIEEGHPHFEAARRATNEVGMAVVSSTATTVGAFIPMLFWPGIIGEFMGFLPLTLIITLTSSLFVALVINPVVTGYFAQVGGRSSGPGLSRTGVKALALVGGVVALVIGVWRPLTLVVLVVSTAVLVGLHYGLMKRIADTFMRDGMPKLAFYYRRFLGTMLERDYSVKRPYLRNTFAIAAFTGGFGLLFTGAILSGALGQAAGMVLMGPGGLLMVLGIAGILLHTVETIFIGAKTSLKAGLWASAFVLALLIVIYISPRPLAMDTLIVIMVFPLTIAAIGGLGLLFGRGRRYLILTDNRARLLNSALGGLFAIVMLFAVAPPPVVFFPDTDPTQVRVAVKGPLGMNIEASNRLATMFQERVDELLEGDLGAKANVKDAVVMVGISNDPMAGGHTSPERSSVTLNVVDFNQRAESSRSTLEKLRARLGGIPSAEFEIQRDQQGPPTGPPVNIEVSGPDFPTIVRLSSQLKDRLSSGAETGAIPGLVDVRDNLDTGRPEIAVRIDRQRAAQFKLNTAQIASTVRTAVHGNEASKFRTGEDEYDITVRLGELDRQSLEAVKSLTIVKDGQPIPLSAIADFRVGSGLGSITRKDLQRMVTVQGNAAPGANPQQVLEATRKHLKEFEGALPTGYRLAYTGENKDQEESFAFLTTALIIGASLILMILIAQFNSLSGPLIIMAAAGLSLIGVMLGLVLTRTEFGIMIFIGIISLVGIVVNNSIVLIDYTMQLQARGMEKREAIIEAGATRLRPVLLTALTTVLGLIPLTFGINIDFVGYLSNFDPDLRIGSQNTQFWGPMGIAIISGLSFATFLTLVIVPTMYSVYDSLAAKLLATLRRAPAAPPSESAPDSAP